MRNYTSYTSVADGEDLCSKINDDDVICEVSPYYSHKMSGKVEDVKSKPRKWSDIANEFTQNTTVHGVRFLYDKSSKSLFRRFIWLVIFFTSLGFFVNQVIKSVIHFTDNPMTVKVEVTFNDTLRFPGVVLCNQNSYKITEADRIDYKPILDDYYEANSTEEKLKVLTDCGEDEADFRRLMVLTAHRAQDLIVRCKWKDEKCDDSNFTTIITDHGVCYSFNMGEKKEPLYMSESGRKSSLQLVLNIEEYENMIGPHFAAGLKLLLCDEKDIAVFQGHGQGIAAGTHTFIGTRVIQIERLAPNCAHAEKLDYYPHYTERACYVECFTKYFVKYARCQAPYMQSDARFCNFYEYTMYYTSLKEKFHDVRDTLCDCKLPCKSTIYQPNFSYLKASEFDIEKILQNTETLQEKYTVARDILQTTKEADWEKDKSLLDPFRRAVLKMERLVLVDIGQILVENKREAQDLQQQATSIYETLEDIYEFQSFVVRKNFFRYVKANNELHFSVVTAKYLEFLSRFHNGLELMTSLAAPGNRTRRSAIFDSLTAELRARMSQIGTTFKAILDCRDAYKRGEAQFLTYRYKDKSHEERDLIIPRALLKQTVISDTWLLQKYSMVYVVDSMNKSIAELSRVYVKFLRILRDAYVLGRYEPTRLKAIEDSFVQNIANFNGNRSIMIGDVFESPNKMMEDKLETISTVWYRVKDGFSQISQYLVSLEATWRKTVIQTWPIIENVKSKTDEYSQEFEVTVRLMGKSQLANAFLSTSTKRSVQSLLEFNEDITMAISNIENSWKWVHEQFSQQLLKGVTKDKNLRRYLQKYHPGLSSGKKFANSSMSKTVKRLKEKSSEWANFSDAIQNTISPFEESYTNIANTLENYVKGNAIDAKFYKDNYLSLVIYFEDMNYQLIEQQAAYTITALLSDIGGSMGLFVGGSVLSLFEILDVFLYNSLAHADKSTKKRRRRQQS